MIQLTKGIFVFLLCIAFLSSCNSSKNTASSIANSSKKSKSKLSDKQKMEFEFTFFEANKAKMLSDLPTSAALFKKCLQIDPSNPAALYELANLLFVNGEYANAETLSREACQLQPENEWYLDLYANSLTRNKKPNDAIKVREKMAHNAPDRLEFKFELAQAYSNAERFDDAIKVLNDVEKDLGVNLQLSNQKKLIYIQQNKLDKAIEEVQKLIDNDPNEVNSYLLLTDLYEANKMNEKAFETYEKIKKIDPQNPQRHLFLSHYYGNKGQAETAFDEMKLAFSSDNLDLGIKMKELMRYYNTADFNDTIKKQAYELLDILEKVNGSDANTFAIYGDFLYHDKQLKEALVKYNHTVEMDKDRNPVWTQILFIESQLNDYASMQKDSKTALELFPNSAIFYFFNGVANLQLSDYKAAIKSLEKGVDLVLDNASLQGQFYANLGDAYYRDKQMGKSDSAYDKALEINPKDTYVLNNYSYYLSLRNVDLNRAEAMSRLANELEPNNGNSQDTYAWILYASAKYVEAKEWIEKAIVNGGEKNAVILEHYGDILYKLNDKSKALEYWIKAKEAGKGSDFLEKKINEKTLFE